MPEQSVPDQPYANTWQDGDLVPIPEADLPPGSPPWWTSLRAWAARSGATPQLKRATITVAVPTDARGWPPLGHWTVLTYRMWIKVGRIVRVRTGEVHRLVAVVPPDPVGRLVVVPQDFGHDTAVAAHVQRRRLDCDAITGLSTHRHIPSWRGGSNPAAPVT